MKKGSRLKRPYEKAIRVNISVHPLVLAEANRICLDKGLAGISNYFEASVRRDAPRLQLANQ